MNELPTIEELDEQYEQYAVLLLERIAERAEMIKLLKMATPEKIGQVREIIADLDDIIEDIEEFLELLDKSRRLTHKTETSALKLQANTDIIEKQMRRHLAENSPEKLELFEAMLEDDGKSH